MLLRLPSNLHYPITVLKVEIPVNESVKFNENVFLYSYVTKVKVGNRDNDEEEEVDKKFVAHFASTLEGTIQSWRVWEGDVLKEPVDICEVEEECPHTMQYLGMCTNCGRDMTESQPGGIQDTNRATIQPLHDTQYLTISQDEANEIDKEAKRRLLGVRKLSLVVDLDQTIIHAAVDPTIAEWQKDKDNPNHEAVKDVRAFQLKDEGPGMRECWYYIKLRPGLQEFLENIAQLYELHIYTMGTRQYAQQIANIVDPDRVFFGDRILSRDESGSMVAKNLERLFPVDTKMVVIIDDRGDVWKWSANLIRVTPFDFFVGIGDINSSFLPKKQEIQATPKVEELISRDGREGNGDHGTNGVAEDGTSTIQNGTSALEQLVAMSGGDDPATRELQSKGQEEIISSQLEEKPLQKMQREQDKKDEAEAAADTDSLAPAADLLMDSTTNGESSPSQASSNTTVMEAESDSSSTSSSTPTPTSTPSKPTKARHSILKNDDEELVHLEARLTAVHTAFYNEYDRKRLSSKGGRVAALTGKKKPPLPEQKSADNDRTLKVDLSIVPDIKKVMPSMKLRVLSGVTIVFSGVLPLGTNIQNADISTWAKTFGARITGIVSRDVTHVIATRVGTAKVKQAVKRGIKVVGTNWLIASIQQWRKLDERPYMLEGAGQRRMETSSDIDGEVDNVDIDKANLTSHDFMLSSSEGEEGSEMGFGDTDEESGNTAPQDKLFVPGGEGAEDVSFAMANSSNAGQELANIHNGVVVEGEDGLPPKKRLRLNTDTDTTSKNVDGDEDSELVDEGSPITINQDDWDDMDAELKEFMGSEVDSESDNDSTSSKLSLRERKAAAAQGRKRRREDVDGGDEGPDRMRSEGGSALKTVKNMRSESNTPAEMLDDSTTVSHPAENAAQREDALIRKEQRLVEDQQETEEAEEEDSDDELARELERELEEGSDEDRNSDS